MVPKTSTFVCSAMKFNAIWSNSGVAAFSQLCRVKTFTL
jgi:hypothetical protein